MSKDPAFLFYSSDFLTGTMTMSFEERGKYITILSLMHQQGRMEEKTISLLVGSISENLKSKFKIDRKGFWYNERLENETEKRRRFVKSRVENGKQGGRPKKANAKPKGILPENEDEVFMYLKDKVNPIYGFDIHEKAIRSAANYWFNQRQSNNWIKINGAPIQRWKNQLLNDVHPDDKSGWESLVSILSKGRIMPNKYVD